MFFCIVLGALMIWVMWSVARRATSGVPGRLQGFIEVLFEFVDNSVKETFHGPRQFVAPLALTIFTWVLLWNTMDLIPVDYLGLIAYKLFGIEYLRAVPSAEVNAPFALSLSVLRSEEHTSELQSRGRLVCRLLLE